MPAPRPRRTHRADPELPRVFTRADAVRAGLSDRQIDYRVRSGAWSRLRRGHFQVVEASGRGASPTVEEARPASARVRLAAAAHALRGGGVAVSHESAAMLYGLPNPRRGWQFPTFTTAAGVVRLDHEVHVLVAPLPTRDVTRTADGFDITTPERTVVDCLRSLPPADGLAIVDAAVRRGLSVGAMSPVLEQQRGWPGIVQARRLVGLADPRRETPLESWSAWVFDEWAVPQPTWQVEIYGRDGDFCGRVDCWWQAGLAGEADGRAKYALAAAERGGADAAGLSRVLDAERSRELKLRRTRADVVRWAAAQTRAASAATLARDVITRLHEAGLANRFSGTAVIPPLILAESTLRPGNLLP